MANNSVRSIGVSIIFLFIACLFSPFISYADEYYEVKLNDQDVYKIAKWDLNENKNLLLDFNAKVYVLDKISLNTYYIALNDFDSSRYKSVIYKYNGNPPNLLNIKSYIKGLQQLERERNKREKPLNKYIIDNYYFLLIIIPLLGIFSAVMISYLKINNFSFMYKSSIIIILRWALFVPLSIVAYILIYAINIHGGNLFGINAFLSELAANIIASCSFVIIGSYIAPCKHATIALILSVFGTVLYTISTCAVLFTDVGKNYELGKFLLSMLCALIGLWIGYNSVKEN